MSGVYGFQGKMLVDASTPSTTSPRFDFQQESLILREDFVDTSGLRGTRSRAGERVRQGLRRVQGQIVFEPTAVELSNLLAWIMGGSPTGSPTVTYPLADTLTSRYVQIDRIEKVFQYSGVYVDRASFEGRQGEPLRVTLDLVGQDETVTNSGTFSSTQVLDIANSPFMFFDAAITINAVTYNARDFTFVLENVIDRERFFNSQTLVTVQPTDRHVRCNFSLPYGDASAVYGLGVAGVAVTVTMTNAGAVFSVPFNNVKFPRISPSYQGGRSEEMLTLEGLAYKTGTTSELSAGVTLNVGP